MWGRQRRGDSGEQAVHGRTGRQRTVHAQSLSHRDAHTQLVPLYIAQGSSASGRGIMERVSLHKDKVKLVKTSRVFLSIKAWEILHGFYLVLCPALHVVLDVADICWLSGVINAHGDGTVVMLNTVS